MTPTLMKVAPGMMMFSTEQELDFGKNTSINSEGSDELTRRSPGRLYLPVVCGPQKRMVISV